MRIIVLMGLMLAMQGMLPAAAWAGDTVSAPWEEFKMLYKESIERRIRESLSKPVAAIEPQTHTIDEAVYRLSLGGPVAQGQVLISGKILGGGPQPVPLFGKELILSSIERIAGGSLIAPSTGTQQIQFLPDGTNHEFQIAVTFMVSPREDTRSKAIGIAIPPALRNTLELTATSGTRVLEAPGIADARGIRHFSLDPVLTLRYLDKGDLAASVPVEIDTFSRFQTQGRRLMVTTHYLPQQAPGQALTLRLPEGAQYLATSLKPSWIACREQNVFEITLPAGEQGPFWVQFAIDETGDGRFALKLPVIQDNTGREGDFAVEEPDDARIGVTGKGLVQRVALDGLHKELAARAGWRAAAMRIPAGETIQLEIKRYQPVGAPPIVLDSQYYYTSFEENGSVLSVMVMDIPPEAGPRILLKPVPGAQIWSLKVNNKERKVYAGDGQDWIVPLDEGVPSHVELAILRQGEKLGLQGRIETTVPETGLAARKLCVGIALPARVDLLSLEGPVSPAPEGWPHPPADFVGKPYFFSRAFHKGEAMNLAVFYKEPVKP
jgi:hypothetical protein